MWHAVPKQTDTHNTNAEEKATVNILLNETSEEVWCRKEQEVTVGEDGWLVTRLPARAELTLVDPFSCTEMEGTLQDRKQGQ